MYLNGKKYRERYLRVKIILKVLEDNFDFLLAYFLPEGENGVWGECMLIGWNYKIPIAVNMPIK